jgi:sulfatase maturation enzyme AslB (radical SAM superfamily)
MKVFYATNLLKLLLYKRILKNRLDWLSLPTDYIFPWLENLDRNGESATTEELSDEYIDILINWGLVSEKPDTRLRKGKSVRPSLAFVFAVNLELSYDCNLDCNHCLQKSIRPEMAGIVLNSEKAIRILEGAWFAGLLKKGVNITGGETISKESSLIRIVEWLGSHKILFRLNTSGWWGGL